MMWKSKFQRASERRLRDTGRQGSVRGKVFEALCRDLRELHSRVVVLERQLRAPNDTDEDGGSP